ncbi:MAG: MlaD family protein [Bacteroidota bacterium]
MQYGNEFKVGVAITVAALIVFFGIRYLAGLPVFGAGYELTAVFEDTEGLASGNPVEVSGVQVGTVREVALLPGAREARAVLSITSDVSFPRGSLARVSGFSALGDVGVAIEPGDPAAPPLEDGDQLVTKPASDIIGLVQNNAERLFGSVDTLLTGAAGTFMNVDNLLAENGDLSETVRQLRIASSSANRLLTSQQDQIAATLASLRRTTESVGVLTEQAGAFADENADSLALTIQRLNGALAGVEASLASFEATSTQLDALLAKLDSGEGTLGLMLNDPTLYENLNTTATNLNQLILEFQADPKRFLKDLRLVDVF